MTLLPMPSVRATIRAAVLLVLTAPASAQPAAAPTAAPSLETRLERLAERLDEQREALHVPGMALAIVHDDEVIFARGFGTADLSSGTPVTPETLFAIGSSTKAFTATLVGMLAEEGRMSWDDPVTRHLPYFRLPVDGADPDDVTIRDLLCHRTGFSRMGILWAGARADRETVLRAATTAEPTDPFRAKWGYNNVMYLAAGEASARAAGTTWDALLAERLLAPLGMRSSNTSVRQSQRDPRLALGYIWQEDKQAFKHLPMRVLDTIAPAGAINSHVLDMARWVRLQLARGVIDGTRLVSEDVIEETWSPQIAMSGEARYGLGWMLREQDGRRVVQHGGAIDGFGAMVTLLPDDDLGFVMLVNVTATPLVELATKEIRDAVMEPGGPAVAGAGAAHDLAPYVGTYVGNFAHFDDADFVVLEQNGRLAVDVPGQQAFELEPPDEDGRWRFVITDQIAVSFDRGDAGNVVAMRMHQAGMTFELPREGVEIAPEIPLAELERYLGRYRSENLKAEVEVTISNNRLALDVPGQMVYELLPPDDEGAWRLRVKPDLAAITFNVGADGRVESLTNVQGGVTEVMPLVEAAGRRPSRSLEEIHALRDTAGRAAALRALGTFRVTGTVRLVNAGAGGTVAVLAAPDGRHRADVDFGVFGSSHLAVDGEGGWSESTFAPFDELSGNTLVQARQGHPAALLGDWRDFFDTVEALPDRTLDGRPVHAVKLRTGDAPPLTLLLDPDTGDALQAQVTILMPGIGGLPKETRFEDYRTVEGVRLPHRIVEITAATGRSVMELTALEPRVEVGPGAFRPTPSAELP